MMKTRVLLIEDDHVDQVAFRRKMDGLPFEYAIAGSIAEAKKLLKKNTYDIVLIDFFLGDGTAFDAFDFVDNTPYIVITGENKADVAVEAIKAGASDYLVKDMNRSYLTLLPTVIKRAIDEHRMKEQFELLSEAMVAVNDSVYISTPDGEIAYVNKTFLNTYGYTEGDIIGEKENVLFAPSNNKDSSQIMGMTHGRVDSVHRRTDGSTFPVSLSVSSVVSKRGKTTYRITVVHDITERKHMEEALMQAIEKFSLLLDIQAGKTALLERNKMDIETNYNLLKETYENLIKGTA